MRTSALILTLMIQRVLSALQCSVSAINNVVFSSQGSFVVGFYTPAIVSTTTLSVSSTWSSDSKRAIVVTTGTPRTTCQLNNTLQTQCVVTATSVTCTANLQAFTFYAITCQNIQNPTSTAPAGVLGVQVQSGTTVLDSCTSLTITNWVPNTMSPQLASFSIQNNGITVTPNTAGQAGIQFTLASPFYINDNIQVNIVPGSGLQFGTTTVALSSTTRLLSILTLVSQNSTSLTYKASNPADQPAGTTFIMSFSQGSMISGPCLNQQNITINTMRGNFYIDYLQYVTFTPQPGTLTIPLITLGDRVISLPSSYAINIALMNPLQSTGYLVIQIPTLMSSGTLSCTMLINSTTLITGTCIANSNQITATNIFGSISPNIYTSLVLEINGLINPTTTNAQPIFSSLQSYYSQSLPFLVDQLNQPYTYTNGYDPGAINSIKITPLSQFVGDTTGMELLFNLSNKIPSRSTQSGYLVLTTPNDIKLQSASTKTCYLQTLIFACSITINSQTMSISGFGSDLSSNQLYNLTITNLFINPLSLRPTGIFTMKSFSSNNIIIDTNTNIQGFTITKPSVISSVILKSRDNTTNGVVATYLFQITLSTPTINGSTITINTPGLTVQQNVTCSSNNDAILNSLPCIRQNSTQIQITLLTANTYVQASTPLLISIQKIGNHKSYAPSPPLGFTIYESSYLVATYNKNDVVVINDQPQTMQSAQVLIGNGILAAQDNYSIIFTTTNQIDTSCYFTIQVPSQITINSVNCSQNYIGFGSPPDCSVKGRTITITPNLLISKNTFGLQFQFTNPTTPTSDQFTISSYEQSNGVGYLMDTYTDKNLVFKAKCQLPCATCSPISNTTCLSCYQNSAISAAKYYSNDQLTCLSQCPSSYYQDELKSICIACNSGCLTCNSNLQCLTCVGDLLLNNGACVAQCDSNQYKSGGTCLKCSDKCLTCSDFSICTSCAPSQFFYQKTCYDTCPNGLFGVNETCVGCTTPCLTCMTSPTQCTSCDPNSDTPLLLGQTCSADCESGYYPSLITGQCLACVYPCSTCLSDQQCLSCDLTNQTFYYYEQQCLTECPVMYYPDGFNCVKCENGCANCTQTTCLSCNPNYLRLGSKCFNNTCPTGYISNYTTMTCIQINATKPNSSKPTNGSNVSNSSNITVIVAQNLSPNKYVPIPYVILMCLVGITVIVSKIHRSETFVPGAFIGLASILEWCSWITVMYLFGNSNQSSDQISALYIGFALHYLLNLVNIILIKIKITPDPEYQKWVTASITHKITIIVIYPLSFLITFKLSRLIYSKYFSFNFFKCKLTSVQEFWTFNTLNGVSILFTTIPIAVGSAVIAYYCERQDQLFISSIDCFIVTLLVAVFQVWETKKEENFFEEQSAQIYYSLNATKIEKADDSGFFHNPFHKQIQAVEADQSLHEKVLIQEESVKASNRHLHEQEVQNGNEESFLVPAQQIQSDRQSQALNQSALINKFNDEPLSNIKSNSKHTIYFGANPTYQRVASNQQPIEPGDSISNRSSGQGAAAQIYYRGNQVGSQSPPPKNQTVPHDSITENQAEADPDEEPSQPLPQSLTIETKGGKPEPQQLQSTVSQISYQPQPFSASRPILEAHEPYQEPTAHLSIPITSVVYNENHPPPNNPYKQIDPDESKLSIFENDDVNDKFQQKRNSFDGSSLAAKTLLHGPTISDHEPSIPQTNNNFVADSQLVEHFGVQVENIENSIMIQQQVQPTDLHTKVKDQITTKKNQERSEGEQAKKDKQEANKDKSTTKEKKDKKPIQSQKKSPAQERGRTLNVSDLNQEGQKKNTSNLRGKVSPNQTQNIGRGNQSKSKSPQIRKPNPEEERLKQIFDSNESVRTLSDANWGENQISPSDFNILNQRYDEEKPKPISKSYPRVQKQQTEIPKSQKKSPIANTNQNHSPPNFSGDEGYLTQGIGQPRQVSLPRPFERATINALDDTSMHQLEQGRLKDMEKIYLQRIEGTTSVKNGKKKQSQHRQRDASDALYIDDNFDEADIIF